MCVCNSTNLSNRNNRGTTAIVHIGQKHRRHSHQNHSMPMCQNVSDHVTRRHDSSLIPSQGSRLANLCTWIENLHGSTVNTRRSPAYSRCSWSKHMYQVLLRQRTEYVTASISHLSSFIAPRVSNEHAQDCNNFY